MNYKSLQVIGLLHCSTSCVSTVVLMATAVSRLPTNTSQRLCVVFLALIPLRRRQQLHTNLLPSRQIQYRSWLGLFIIVRLGGHNSHPHVHPK